MSILKSKIGKFVMPVVTKAKRYISGILSFVIFISLFTFIAPNVTKPAYADLVLTASVTGTDVTFTFGPANTSMALLVYNSTNNIVHDSGALSNGQTRYVWNASPFPNGDYHAQVFAFGTAPFSNVATFTLGGGGSMNLTASASGSTVTFTMNPGANSSMALLVYNSTNNVVHDSGALGNISTYTWNAGLAPNGNYHAQVFAFGTTAFSNIATFTLGGGGGFPFSLKVESTSGNTVTFRITPTPGPSVLVIKNSSGVRQLPDPDATGNATPQWTGTNGTYTAVLSAFATDVSNTVSFNLGGGGGKNWNDPGEPAPPFNIMDVFQPAKRFGSFGQLASDILLILVSLAGGLALIFIIISGFKFVTSSGDEKKLASARATLTYAIIGIAVVILAFVIVQVLQYFLQSSVPIT